MAAVIQPLSTDLIHRITAGEVISSLAAAVRELLENALDAGATRINIDLWPDEWRLRIVDNGCGFDLVDLKQAAAPHTTSKISSAADLDQISTLGFRGEALHSLAQVGKLEICSRSTTTETGWRTTYDAQGQPQQLETIAIAPGTIVTISHLFAKWPKRRQAMSANQQLRSVQAVIHRVALCHPHVTWQVQQNHRHWFSIAPGKTAQDILPQILNSVHPRDLQSTYRSVTLPQLEPTKTKDQNVSSFSNCNPAVDQANQIELVLGLPDRCHRHRPDWIWVAVNGRCVGISGDEGHWSAGTLRPLPELEQTILNVFRQILPRHRYPLCFVHLRIAPELIDWNRHPAKIEIYLHALEFWQTQITQTIQQALQIPFASASGEHSTKVQQLIRAAESKGFYNLNRSLSQLPKDNQEGLQPLPEANLSSLRAVAQIHKTYILAEHATGLWLVEQHIAHERVLYEQLCQEWQVVELETPLILSNLSSAQVEQLQQLNITIEPFGNNLWAVRSVPQLLAEQQDQAAALLELSSQANVQMALVATACRSAIRNGTTLSLTAMQTLLDQWQRTLNPRTCPHGRPIFLSLEENELARFFRRHWVIGKSHGI